MTTRVVVASDVVPETSAKTDVNGTATIRSKSKQCLEFLVCDDPENHSPFVNPRAGPKKTRKSLGGQKPRSWPCRSTTPSWILNSIALVDKLLVSWWLMHFLNAYHKFIPLAAKRKLLLGAWEWYLWIHTRVVCQWMGFYSDQSFYTGETSRCSLGEAKKTDEERTDDAGPSDEFKALSTLLYPCQFFVVDVPRIRFSLSQLNSISLKEVPSDDSVEKIAWTWSVPGKKDTDKNHGFTAPGSQRDHQTVSGLFVTNPNGTGASNGPKKALFWIYGGAYLGGDAEGNLSIANEFMVDCNADCVFIPSYRLAPEATIDDVLWDICWSYRYLLQRLQQQNPQQNGFEIVLVGISSGGALALRLLQFLRDRSSKLPLMPSFLEPVIDDIRMQSTSSATKISGAVLFGPYVDYRDPQPRDGSFLRNAKFDWVVTEAVQHYGLPYLNGFIPPMDNDLNSKMIRKNTHGRIQYSPLTHDMSGLPPLCLIASEHEACYDMAIEIVNKARGNAASDGDKTDVTIGVWKYMCHVFSMMQAFLPEGKASVEFAKDWIRTKTTDRE